MAAVYADMTRRSGGHGSGEDRLGCCAPNRRDNLVLLTAAGAAKKVALTKPTKLCADVNTHPVGSLQVMIGCNAAFLPANRDHGLSPTMDDWVLAFRTHCVSSSERREGGNCSVDVRIQPASCPVPSSLTGEIMFIRFPRSTFRGLENQIEAICAGKVEFSASPLLVAYLESLKQHLPMLKEHEQHVVEAVTNQLVRSCIVRSDEVQGNVSKPASRNRLEAAKRFIDDRLASPNLTVETVQAALGVSRRQLYSLFQSYGGVAHYILSQRLRRCHSALAATSDDRGVGRIAEQYGIDPTRMDKLFRDEFGYGPEDVRQKARLRDRDRSIEPLGSEREAKVA